MLDPIKNIEIFVEISLKYKIELFIYSDNIILKIGLRIHDRHGYIGKYHIRFTQYSSSFVQVDNNVHQHIQVLCRSPNNLLSYNNFQNNKNNSLWCQTLSKFKLQILVTLKNFNFWRNTCFEKGWCRRIELSKLHTKRGVEQSEYNSYHKLFSNERKISSLHFYDFILQFAVILVQENTLACYCIYSMQSDEDI